MPRDFPALPGFYQALFLYFEPCQLSPPPTLNHKLTPCHGSVNGLPCLPGVVLARTRMVSRTAHPRGHLVSGAGR